MRRSPLCRWVLVGTVALTTLGTGSGCMGHLRPLEPPPAELTASCQALTPGCRDHVYIFMVNGLTLLPHVCGSMNGVAAFVEQLGFCKPRVASHYWRWCFQNEIRRIHQEDPAACFVLVGYSIGGSVVYSMAQTLEEEGIFIDLMVYIDAHSFIHDLNQRPANVGKVVGINSTSWCLSGKCHPGEECHWVETLFHLKAPRKEQTLHTLARELTELATTHCCGSAKPRFEGAPPELSLPEPAAVKPDLPAAPGPTDGGH